MLWRMVNSALQASQTARCIHRLRHRGHTVQWKREKSKERLWEIKWHNSYCTLWTSDFLMAWLSAPTSLKCSTINRGIDFGHHIQDSTLLSFTTAETLHQWNGGVDINIQPSISHCWNSCCQMAMRYMENMTVNWSWPTLLFALTIEARLRPNSGLTIDMLFNSNHRCVTNQCNHS